MNYRHDEPRLLQVLRELPGRHYEPTTVTGWLNGYGTTYQSAIKRAIFTKEIEAVYGVLRALEPRPFPFDLATLTAYRDAYIKEYWGDIDE